MKSLRTLFVRKISHPADFYVVLAILAYGIYFSVFTVTRHWAYQTQSYDLSFYVQSLWNTAHGEFLRVTVQPGLENFLQVHFSPSLLLFVPLYAIWPAPEWLLILQSIILATGAWPVHRLASERMKNKWLGLPFALAYLFFPALQAANLYDFHEITIAAPLLMWAWYFASMSQWHLQWRFFALFAVLGLGLREEAVLILLGMGMLLALRKETRKAGLFTLAGSLVWLVVLMNISFRIPGTSINASMHFENRFGLGETPAAAVRSLWHDPGLLAERLLAAPKILYYLNLYAPVGFLSLVSGINLFLVLPSVFLNALGTYDLLFSAAQAQYNVLFAPFIILAAADGAEMLITLLTRKIRYKRRFWQFLVVSFLLLLSLGYQFRLAHLPYSPYFQWPQVTERHKLANELANQIPLEASLSALDNLAPHASHRLDLYIFPIVNDAEYVFLDVALIQKWKEDGVLDFTQQLAQIRSDPDYAIIWDHDGYLLLRKKD